MAQSVRVCSVADIEEEDVMRFDHGDQTFAIYRCPDGAFFATDGYCTHEGAHLGDGIVDGYEIECPLHFGAFDYRNGEPTVAPACVRLKTFPATVEDGAVFITID
ncbi:MAG: Rieske 2Fe-2S domain-containing protein [Hyphomicrobiales bacterium]|nr:Rieske 2Fe-2S domain-containing protein [Hyphomicrobiales bacterium]